MIEEVRPIFSASDIVCSSTETRGKCNISSPFWSQFWPLSPTSFSAGLAQFPCPILATGPSNHWNLYLAGSSFVQHCQGMFVPWLVSKLSDELYSCDQQRMLHKYMCYQRGNWVWMFALDSMKLLLSYLLGLQSIAETEVPHDCQQNEALIGSIIGFFRTGFLLHKTS